MKDNPAARRHMSAVIQALNIPQEPPTTEEPEREFPPGLFAGSCASRQISGHEAV
jgi:hypothetical protein